jgi:hypothetical protein
MEDVGIFYDHLVLFMAIGNILWRFVYFVVIWYIFPLFGILDQEKTGNPGPPRSRTARPDMRTTHALNSTTRARRL